MEKIGAYTERVTPEGEWRPGNPGLGQSATPMLASYFTMMQREAVAVVEAAGLVLSSANDRQLLRAIRGGVITLSASTALTAVNQGLVLLDASGGNRTFTLPDSATAVGPADFLLRRVDTSANALVIATAGTDKIMLDQVAAAAGQSTTELLFAGDYLRLRSDGSGKWWCVGQAQLPASIATGQIYYSAAGVYNTAVPPVLRSGRLLAKVYLKGGGAGGGRDSAGAPGGGEGGSSEKLLSLAGVSNITITVGAKGPGGQTNGSAGVNGGTTSFGAIFYASGGQAGIGSNAGAPGAGFGGDINKEGGWGSPAAQGATGILGGFGGGGSSPFSGSGIQHATVPGHGGGGRTTVAGRDGADGEARVTWG